MASSRKPAAAKLQEHVHQALIGYLETGRRLCLALSGGVDSVALLDILDGFRRTLDFSLSAVHVHHHLSPHADAWAAFCVRLCAARDIPLHVARVRVRRRRELGPEAAAREARYRVLLAQPADYVVLAHHLDDQVETVFLNLLRGSGVRGLAGMPAVRKAGGPRLLRPLITVPRAVILAYAKQRQLSWVEDESNRDTRLLRNFLRRNVLPLIESRFPAYREAVLRASEHLAEADSLLDELGALDLARHGRDGRLEVAGLAALSAPRAKNLLRVFFQAQGAPMPDAARLHEMWRQLLSAAADARIEIPWGDFVLRRYRGQAWVENRRPLPSQEWRQAWHGESRLKLPELGCVLECERTLGAGLSSRMVENHALELRLRRGGERLRPDCRGPRRSLKNLLQEAGVPPWLRTRLPLLWSGDTLVAVPGIGVDCGWQAAPNEVGLALRVGPL
ncbi:tRNA lysidine(34) synthetase TilS [Thiobacter aerophilum]|uniref:tRNA(Ile)-lysidine synthase n=1 Tax=Thiobacter aerophilum TaxID=3121275 RepID=A0ABV0EI70_9BURK